MDDKSKLKMMLFFDYLRREMDDFDCEGLQVYPTDRKGYYVAVDKMNFYIQKFIKTEIKDGERKR